MPRAIKRAEEDPREDISSRQHSTNKISFLSRSSSLLPLTHSHSLSHITMRFTALIVAALAAAVAAKDCGFKIAPCPAGKECVPKKSNCLDLNKCPGQCRNIPVIKEYQACGGNARPAPTCATGTTCRDDPRVPGCGLACDRQGICIPDKAPQCGGIAGLKCPNVKGQDYVCYDFPNDECDPATGGADCTGVCLAPLKKEDDSSKSSSTTISVSTSTTTTVSATTPVAAATPV
ncbi:hypothetical protein F5X68DRAFT_198746 [Plectosphaerella plurivora]|uniref:Uncharacterized protein n=1 Tax=Plectosphaerella plurivora TaxID=936078 RepID=A0A9P8VLG8_9PEZI|nr:hypothetical protein F5X68DRAFT_198746 [Plectosphaerella plurivora]